MPKLKIAKTLPNGVQIPEKDEFIWNAYKCRCVFHPRTWAVCLHEEPPKSQNPYWERYPESRFPLCNACHEQIHSMNRVDAITELLKARMKNFPNAVKEIDSHDD